MDMESTEKTIRLNDLAKEFHQFQIEMGFTDSNISQRLMLIVSEISEAFEAFRKDKIADLESFENSINSVKTLYVSDAYFKHEFERLIKDTLEDEMADGIIRSLAFCGENNIDIEKHIELKMKYNRLRGYKYGGKKY